ncbi:sulfatase family protein [Thermomonospora umbrina]|uniref:Arylsulfatase A-like enzyme n=1 Tax=Thermomonospora umbrina TaxID=111806 RepID=A0A3D9SRH2_9ACTN|nr:sulfatase [Thermomonospora umbrina]REE96553.1 arylsulfatase A-like enzyme [Thermomonospora umbrina]
MDIKGRQTLFRRRLNRLAAGFGIGLMALSACADGSPAGALRGSGEERGAQRPNIIFVLTDDLSTDLVPHMPTVRRMQRTGVTFSNYFATNSLCCPSRATIFTGRFPHNTGVVTNYPPNGGYQAFHERGGETRSYAKALQAAGYRTALMGKYLNGYEPAGSAAGAARVPPGWSEWYVAGDGYSGFNYTLSENGRRVRYGSRPGDYMTDVLSTKGIQFIQRSKAAKKPFMMQVSLFTPHGPIVPAPRHAGAVPALRAPRPPSFNEPDVSDKPRWLRSRPALSGKGVQSIDEKFRKRVRTMLSVDEMIARFQRQLGALGLARNTYLVFSSDNGFHLGQHRLLSGKMTAFDTDIRVPLIVTGPNVPADRTVNPLTQNTDIHPTLLNLAGVPVPAGIDGRALTPWIHGRAVRPWRSAVLVQQRKHDLVAYDPDRQGPADGNPPSYWALRLANSLYVEYANGEREYYDTARDPHQLHNRARALSPARLRQLSAALRALKTCSGARCRTADQAR